jgi:hypothetical protein
MNVAVRSTRTVSTHQAVDPMTIADTNATTPTTEEITANVNKMRRASLPDLGPPDFPALTPQV